MSIVSWPTQAEGSCQRFPPCCTQTQNPGHRYWLALYPIQDKSRPAISPHLIARLIRHVSNERWTLTSCLGWRNFPEAYSSVLSWKLPNPLQMSGIFCPDQSSVCIFFHGDLPKDTILSCIQHAPCPIPPPARQPAGD